ncbi:MAG: hypothetical protein M3R12_08475, partial [Actinomycetota bacterium]|nr:hypothetical protein [Actinomycetota bacterium]
MTLVGRECDPARAARPPRELPGAGELCSGRDEERLVARCDASRPSNVTRSKRGSRAAGTEGALRSG